MPPARRPESDRCHGPNVAIAGAGARVTGRRSPPGRPECQNPRDAPRRLRPDRRRPPARPLRAYDLVLLAHVLAALIGLGAVTVAGGYALALLRSGPGSDAVSALLPPGDQLGRPHPLPGAGVRGGPHRHESRTVVVLGRLGDHRVDALGGGRGHWGIGAVAGRTSAPGGGGRSRFGHRPAWCRVCR